jgi:hypothetical protein
MLIEKTVKARKVREGDFIPGLDNAYVFTAPQESDTNPDYFVKILFNDQDGDEGCLDVQKDMPITIKREGKEQPAPEPVVVEPTPLTPEMVSARMDVLTGLRDVRAGLSTMLNFWDDQPFDLLRGEEFPFHRSLDDLEAEVRHAIELIEENNDKAMEGAEAYKPPTLTVRELIAILSDYPGDTLLLGYTDATDYVNIDGIGNTDFEGGPALVIETRQDYDPRQF